MTKRTLTLGLALTCLLGLNSCDKDKPFLGAKVEVSVSNILEQPQKGMTVYMFKDNKITSDTKIADADKQVITNDEGVAIFSLNLLDLNIIESQTSLYFGVFLKIGDEELVYGSAAVTVKKGDEKEVDIKVLL